MGSGTSVLAGDASDPEIGQASHDRGTGGHEDVLGFDVAMNNACRVHDRQGIEHLRHDVEGGGGAEIATTGDQRAAEIASVDEVHDDGEVVAFRDEIVHAHEVRVIE